MTWASVTSTLFDSSEVRSPSILDLAKREDDGGFVIVHRGDRIVYRRADLDRHTDINTFLSYSISSRLSYLAYFT
jgi:hypothetical protein